MIIIISNLGFLHNPLRYENSAGLLLALFSSTETFFPFVFLAKSSDDFDFAAFFGGGPKASRGVKICTSSSLCFAEASSVMTTLRRFQLLSVDHGVHPSSSRSSSGKTSPGEIFFYVGVAVAAFLFHFPFTFRFDSPSREIVPRPPRNSKYIHQIMYIYVFTECLPSKDDV